MPSIETNKKRIAARLTRDGWVERQGGSHDVFSHPDRKVTIVVPRHRSVSIGVARKIARQAGWI